MVQYEDRYVTATPEGVRLDVVLAGLGSRFAAYAIDLAVQVALFVAFVLTLGHLDKHFGSAGLLVELGSLAGLALFDFLGYFVLFEMFTHGRSLGKMAMGLRVVRTGGQPVGFLASLVRNLVRFVDIQLAGLVGMVLILVTPRNQRLGDLAASTIVIRERVAADTALTGAAFASGTAFSAPAGASGYFGPVPPEAGWLPPELRRWDVSAVPAEELMLARAFLANRQGYTPEARQQLALQLAGRIWPYVAGPASVPPPEAFLEMVVQVKAARG